MPKTHFFVSLFTFPLLTALQCFGHVRPVNNPVASKHLGPWVGTIAFSAQPPNKASDREIACAEVLVGHQILPNGSGISATTQAEFDGLPERLAEGGFRRGYIAQPYAKPGDHLVGRFCFSFFRKVVGIAVRGWRFRRRPGDHFVGRFCWRAASP